MLFFEYEVFFYFFFIFFLEFFKNRLWGDRSRPSQFFPTSPPPDWSLNPLKETFLQPVLKSFITVFTIIKGWKINQQELRFLGLAKLL